MKSNTTIWYSSPQKKNHMRQKQVLLGQNNSFASKTNCWRKKTKVVVSSFWSKAIQVRGTSQHNKLCPQCWFSHFFLLTYYCFFMREQVSDRPAQIPCVVLPITSHQSLELDFWSNKHILQRFASFVWYY